MMKVILVEDEPSAMRHLKSIIEMRCSGYEIADTAENGAEALEKIRMLKPDVVITDIKMPVMDGIGLVSRVKEEFPFIRSIIVSGYQDFEYAKGAIQSGVVDYLLKPVNISQLKALLDTILQKLEKEYYQKRVELVGRMIAGGPAEAWEIDKYLPFRRYSMGILRQNGLPSRFASNHSEVSTHLEMEACIVSCETVDLSVLILPGRDRKELIFFHIPELNRKARFEKWITAAAEKLVGGYYTAVVSPSFSGLQDCTKVISGMYRTLDNHTIPGHSQILHALSEGGPAPDSHSILDGILANKLGFLVSNALYNELKQEIIKLFSVWEKEQRTQLWVESMLRQILQHIEKLSANTSAMQTYDIELLLDEALFYSTTFGELMANVWELVEKIVQRGEKKNQKADTPCFFHSIEKYMEQNLAEPLSLPSVCASFGISQTYLSRLFRKYKNMSFNEYLTAIRVEKAKQLIAENPQVPLKEVAVFVGYADPFYFSRVFRSVTGVPPSEYIPGNLR